MRIDGPKCWNCNDTKTAEGATRTQLCDCGFNSVCKVCHGAGSYEVVALVACPECSGANILPPAGICHYSTIKSDNYIAHFMGCGGMVYLPHGSILNTCPGCKRAAGKTPKIVRQTLAGENPICVNINCQLKDWPV